MIKIDLSQERPAVRTLFLDMLEESARDAAESLLNCPLKQEDQARFLLLLVRLGSQLKEPALAVMDVPKAA